MSEITKENTVGNPANVGGRPSAAVMYDNFNQEFTNFVNKDKLYLSQKLLKDRGEIPDGPIDED